MNGLDKMEKIASPASKKGIVSTAKRVALAGVMTATLIGGKLALASLPNIEIVTLLCALYGYVFGLMGIGATVVFVLCETLIWGFGPWVISYFIYWPLVCLVFFILGKCRIKNRYILTAAAALLTVLFSVLTSLVDVGLFMGEFDRFWLRFSVYYMRGIVFYIIHIVCNAALFLSAFPLLERVLTNAYVKRG